ncbi:unnamed protein product [Protopolystoma xenopodis]|uniref:Uncharacterized protein n=1 Tax=Protopolystoma xenopodis TaxID=117903 RepID=A0A3S5AZE2_9PLAT|nr:unnamed protein product [Protopolystoma xenopodis]
MASSARPFAGPIILCLWLLFDRIWCQVPGLGIPFPSKTSIQPYELLNKPSSISSATLDTKISNDSSDSKHTFDQFSDSVKKNERSIRRTSPVDVLHSLDGIQDAS